MALDFIKSFLRISEGMDSSEFRDRQGRWVVQVCSIGENLRVSLRFFSFSQAHTPYFFEISIDKGMVYFVRVMEKFDKNKLASVLEDSKAGKITGDLDLSYKNSNFALIRKFLTRQYPGFFFPLKVTRLFTVFVGKCVKNQFKKSLYKGTPEK